MDIKYYPDGFSSYEEYVEYLREKGFVADIPECLNEKDLTVEQPKTYKDEMALQYSYLDKIDIEKYMKHCTTGRIDDLISAIERDYNFTDFTNNYFLEGFIFNNCSEPEFIEYLEDRFGRRFRSSEVSYRTFKLD